MVDAGLALVLMVCPRLCTWQEEQSGPVALGKSEAEAHDTQTELVAQELSGPAGSFTDEEEARSRGSSTNWMTRAREPGICFRIAVTRPPQTYKRATRGCLSEP